MDSNLRTEKRITCNARLSRNGTNSVATQAHAVDLAKMAGMWFTAGVASVADEVR
jgi:hypothetical protein